MFSNEEIRNIYALLPPAKSDRNDLPSLILAASGSGFITRDYVQARLEQRMNGATERIHLSNISSLLDIDESAIVQLVRDHSHLALLSHDQSHVIPRCEREMLQRKLHETISSRLVSKPDFEEEVNIDARSLEVLLTSEDDVIEYDGCVCNKTYSKSLSESVLNLIERAISNITIVNISPQDADQLPGSPPMWLVSKYFNKVIDTYGLTEQVFIRETPSLIQCHSAHAKERNVQAWTRQLLSGENAFLDLKDVFNCSDMFELLEEVETSFSNVNGVEVHEHYAISARWVKDFVHRSLQGLHYDGAVNVANQIQMEVPGTVLGYVVDQVEQSILATQTDELRPEPKFRQVGQSILTEERYELEKETLLASAKEAGATEWQALTSNHDYVLKFDFNKVANPQREHPDLQQALLKDRAIVKAAEEHFWNAISASEAQNEVHFANFWTERVTTRTRIYNTALSTVEDQKLRTQLSELLATYIKKDMLSDSINKARTQGLVLSRKTRKNIQKLGSTLQTTAVETSALLSTIEKFGKKQGIEDPSAATLEDSKQIMVRDMVRRMQKHQKASDGPVLFLTLVIVLFAKYYEGVVYATGKYAPKILKQLKEKLEDEQYEQVEKWKEAAKTGTLSTEDREEMRTMAES